MPLFHVHEVRTEYQDRYVYIEAESEEEAKEIAESGEEDFGDVEWVVQNADQFVDSVQEIPHGKQEEVG
jgi:hypothetical protein